MLNKNDDCVISVIIPCFNAMATLRQTILSVLQQKALVEIIVVNDGSTDGSEEVARQFGSRIRYVATYNRGVSAARNTGLALATGQFVLYLDSDDLLTKGTLTVRLDALRRSGADVAWTAFESFGDHEPPSHSVVYMGAPPVDREELEIAVATSRVWTPPGALLFRRSLIERMDGWRTDLLVVQDVAFILDAVMAGGQFVAVPEVGLRYRIQSTSLSHSNASRFIADCARLAALVEALWTGHKQMTQGRRRALADMWANIAMSSLMQGFPEFEEAVDGYNRHASSRLTFEAGRLMRRMLTAKTCAKIANRSLLLKQHYIGR